MNHKGHEGHKECNDQEEHIEDKDQHKKHDKPAPIPREIERVIREAIGAAIDVHRELGPGFIEPVYLRALVIALRYRQLFDGLRRFVR